MKDIDMGHIRKNSKFLSLVLRHKPEEIGLLLDSNGWANVAELLCCMNKSGCRLTFDYLCDIVKYNDKQRFTFNEDMTLIRANQGHSINVDLEFETQEPPEKLYHGTSSKFFSSIKEKGLIPKSRIHVHLSKDIETAFKVGKRHGYPAIVLTIDSLKMWEEGYKFYLSKNGVWLTDSVPEKFIMPEFLLETP